MGGIVPKSTHDKVTDPLKLVPDDRSDPLGVTDGGKTIAAPVPPAPPPAAPSSADAVTRLRAQREAQDAQTRKRGRRSTVVTGDEGVASSPLGRKTLVGS